MGKIHQLFELNIVITENITVSFLFRYIILYLLISSSFSSLSLSFSLAYSSTLTNEFILFWLFCYWVTVNISTVCRLYHFTAFKPMIFRRICNRSKRKWKVHSKECLTFHCGFQNFFGGIAESETDGLTSNLNLSSFINVKNEQKLMQWYIALGYF